jgi:hypothetical protein
MRPILPAAVVLAASLAAAIVWETRDVSEPVAAPAAARSTAQGGAVSRQGVDRKDVAQGWVSTALERPLFRENRRPVKVSGDPARSVDEPLRLTGVITGPFGNRAIFLSSESPKPIVAEEGARVEGFIVRTIEPGLAVLEGSAGNVRTLKPSFSHGEGSPKRTP